MASEYKKRLFYSCVFVHLSDDVIWTEEKKIWTVPMTSNLVAITNKFVLIRSIDFLRALINRLCALQYIWMQMLCHKINAELCSRLYK